MNKIAAFLYGILSYVLCFATLLYSIGFVCARLVPKTIDTGPAAGTVDAIVIDLALMSVFAVQHSLMARRQFKQWWTKFVPKPVERSTYVLFASLALILLFWQWRPLPAVIWQIADPSLAAVATGVSLLGWVIVLSSTFLINHFELFGLQQVTRNLGGHDIAAPRFRTPLFYRFVRHPIYSGFIIAFWVTPLMTAGHLLFATVTTAYILIGIMLEERDLIDLFGDDYRHYRTRVAMLVPWRKSA
jgi:protein-S-isoprenylcysteine O-methyltransferase Ste14